MRSVESGFQHGTWDLYQESGEKHLRNGFKFLWSGGCKAENGAGVIVANWLFGKFVGVERSNDRVMKVNIVIGDVV